jgi:glycosyltransferase involved in cell wall biosynthesis
MHSLHKGLLARGVEVHVLADVRQVRHDYQEYEGVPIWGVPFPVLTSHALRPGNIKLWLAMQTIRRVALERIPRPDLIQVTTFRQPAMVGHWLAGILGVPWVVRLAGSGNNGDLTYVAGNWLTRRQLPKMITSVSQIVALDEHTRQEAIAHGAAPDRVKIIQSGIIFRRPPTRDGRLFREGQFPFLYLGRLVKGKCVESLLSAFHRSCDGTDPMPRLILAGDGDQRSSLEEYASQLGISGRCDFLGVVLNPEDILEKAGCLVNPSESEGLPNAVLEAAAYGLPLILSDIPVHREIAEAVGMTDYLFPVGDSTTLAERLVRYANLDRAEKERLSHRCALFGKRFALEIRDQQYFDLYTDLLLKKMARIQDR